MPTITLNSDNITSTNYNNILTYNFQGGGVSFQNNDICLGQMSIYYSWFNISNSIYKNTTFSYTWIDGTIVNITLPDGLYSINAINSYLENQMVLNTHYLIDNNGNYVYYLQFTTNVVYYSVQYVSYAVPAILPAGWSQPVGSTWLLPLSDVTPQITIFPLQTVSNFGDVIGFNAGTYPSIPQNSIYSKLSDYTPQISPVSSVNINCSLISNPYSPQSKLLYSFGLPAIQFGQQIVIQPSFPIYQKISDGNYNQFEVSITDQNNKPLPIQDPQLCIVLVIRNSGTNQ